MARKISAQDQVKEKWSKQAKNLPYGGRLEFEVNSDHVWLHIIELPSSMRGKGTQFMTQLLAAADQAGLSVSITADPTDRPGDPTVYDLVKWYSKLGFKLYGLDSDSVALMERPVGSRFATPDTLYNAYKKAVFTMSKDEFTAWEKSQYQSIAHQEKEETSLSRRALRY